VEKGQECSSAIRKDIISETGKKKKFKEGRGNRRKLYVGKSEVFADQYPTLRQAAAVRRM